MNKIKNLKKLLHPLNYTHLSIEDESIKHSSHYKEDVLSQFPSHVKIIIISDVFEGKNMIERHRMVNKKLQIAYENGLHAASIKAFSNDTLFKV